MMIYMNNFTNGEPLPDSISTEMAFVFVLTISLDLQGIGEPIEFRREYLLVN